MSELKELWTSQASSYDELNKKVSNDIQFHCPNVRNVQKLSFADKLNNESLPSGRPRSCEIKNSTLPPCISLSSRGF